MKTTHLSLCTLLLLFVAPLAKGGDVDASKDGAASKALTFPISYTGEEFANLSGGYKRGAIYEGLLSVGVQGDLDKLIHWKGGSFLVSGIYPFGPSLTDNYVHDFNRLSNIDAYDSPRLYEAWVQQEFADGKVSLRLGQILADTEFSLSDNAQLFINSAFGEIPVISMNFLAPVFPTPAPGMRMRWTATEAFSLQVGLFDGDAGNQSTDNKHGVDWSFNEGVLAITEIAYKINSEKESKGLPGVYKVGAFFHNQATNEILPNLPARANAGGYFVADQQLWRKPGTEDQGLGGFARIGAAPEDRSVVPLYFDTGFNYKGLLPGRDKDIAGIALSYTSLSGDLLDDQGNPPTTHHETILEGTYKVILNEHFFMQPDFQYIFNPGGTQKAPNAVVAGLRFAVSF